MHLTTLVVTALLSAAAAGTRADTHCTRGRLFASDADSATVHVFELDELQLASTTAELSPIASVPVAGAAAPRVYSLSTNLGVGAVSMGNASSFWDDGVVSFVDSGVRGDVHEMDGPVTRAAPSAVAGAQLHCTRPIHFVSHRGITAVFCDGAYDAVPQANATAHFLDEYEMMRGAGAGLLWNITLEGSHHGVAVPIDRDGHYLVSVTTEERAARVDGASALPNGFDVFGPGGEVLHSLNNDSDPHASCVGFHGSGHIGDDFAFACNAASEDDDGHGGILSVRYDPDLGSYSSRKVTYPSAGHFDGYRTGVFDDHPRAETFLGNLDSFAAEAAYLVSVPVDAAGELPEARVALMPSSPCGEGIDKAGGGGLVYVLLPDGRVRAYETEPEWAVVAEVAAVDGMESCDGALLVVGHGHVYVLAGSRLVDVDMRALGAPVVTSRSLGFTPAFAAVSGVPARHRCDAPAVPAAAPAGRAHTDRVFRMSAGVYDAELVPGSDEAAAFARGVRRALAAALGVPVTRVFVTAVQRTGGAGSAADVTVRLVGPGADDADDTTAEELAASLASQVAAGSLDAALPAIDSESGVSEPSGQGSGDSSSSWSDGATAAVVVAAAVAVGAAAVAIVAKRREGALRAKYERADQQMSAA